MGEANRKYLTVQDQFLKLPSEASLLCSMAVERTAEKMPPNFTALLYGF
jgi:hypothetical protein